ncbi:unnamed protein product [Amoebophrya sp. A25]|nr:unnamed protein product [Amoebophrya sp. A25]|eukprot:GSA25T00020919001.1
MDPAGQPVGMMPMQPGPVIMAPGQGGPMVGQPVMGAPIGGQAPMMMGGAGAPMGEAKVEWQKPRVCAECDYDCCLALCCPCISAKQIMGKIAMPVGAWFNLIAAIVIFRSVTDAVGRVFENNEDLWWVNTIMRALNFFAGIAFGVCMMSWKNKLGQHMNVSRDGVNPCEEFCCMWCCSCYAITAVGRTADDYARFARPAGGMMMAPAGGMQPVMMMPAGGMQPVGMQPVGMQPVQHPVMMQPVTTPGYEGQNTTYSQVN